MNKLLLSLSLCVALGGQAVAQIIPHGPGMWANSELDHKFGTNVTYGQAVAFYPDNVLTQPPSDASPDNPSYMQTDVVSIGRNGYVSLGFNPLIVNGPGYDFIVFENVLRTASGDFGEWMRVEVSKDGNTWYKFPYDTVSGEGMAGRKVTKDGSASTFKDTSICGGDAFDLSVVGLDTMKYIRLYDATNYQAAMGCSICTSADLDAIAAVWQVGDAIPNRIPVRTMPLTKMYYANDYLYINSLAKNTMQVQVYGLQGNMLQNFSTSPNASHYLPLVAGVYMIKVQLPSGEAMVQKMVIQ